jgi:small subunit ribosomal protein S1
VTKVVAFGAFVEILPGVEGLVHISELADHHVENPSEVVEPGAKLNVKILEIDEERRRLSLSIKRVEGQNMPMQGLGEQIAQAEGDPPAGPVAEDDSSSSQAAGEEPSSTPPAGEAPESSDPAPAAEQNGTTNGDDEGGEHQEGESVSDRPDSPDEVDEAAGDDAQTGESEQD